MIRLRPYLVTAVLVCLVAVGIHWLTAAPARANNTENSVGVVHSVYFTLNDPTPKAKAGLVDSCKKYLSKHPGLKSILVGTRAEELDRSVNDLEFDVALHMVFETMAAHDQYQTAERHLQFIEENRESWKNVRVFDTHVAP